METILIVLGFIWYIIGVSSSIYDIRCYNYGRLLPGDIILSLIFGGIMGLFVIAMSKPTQKKLKSFRKYW